MRDHFGMMKDLARYGKKRYASAVVYSSSSPIEAHMVRGMLEDSGIECLLSNEFIAAVESPLSNLTGGVQVLVRDFDADRAGEILREVSPAA